jgi:putative SOS response-associated peptidase YedK
VCGRFTIISDPVAFQLEFDLPVAESWQPDWQPHYNVTPTQLIPIVDNAQERKINWMQWGLLPVWAKEKKDNYRLINVRAETILEKVTFRKIMQKGQRCLILADGFYEWQAPAKGKGPKTPFYFHLKGSKPFAFAGLWDISVLPDGQSAPTCAIITCAPNELVSPVHNRMPVILDAHKGWAWMSSQPDTQLLSLLQPFPAKQMEAYAVSPLVNSPASDQPECIQPAKPISPNSPPSLFPK